MGEKCEEMSYLWHISSMFTAAVAWSSKYKCVHLPLGIFSYFDTDGSPSILKSAQTSGGNEFLQRKTRVCGSDQASCKLLAVLGQSLNLGTLLIESHGRETRSTPIPHIQDRVVIHVSFCKQVRRSSGLIWSIEVFGQENSAKSVAEALSNIHGCTGLPCHT